MAQLRSYTWGDPDHPPLLCLHGIRAYGLRFRQLAEERLAERYFTVALDLRGHGDSTFDPPWNIQTHLSDACETLDGLGIRSAVWIGHSFGGRLALEAARREPDRIAAAILLDPAIELSAERAREGADSERPERVYDSRRQAILERIESGFVRESSRPHLEEEADVHMLPTPDGRFRLRYEQAAAVTAWGECAGPLGAVPPIPTLLVTGFDSGFVTDAQIEVLKGALGAELEAVMVPGGHVVLWDAFEETAAAIASFLSSLSKGW